MRYLIILIYTTLWVLNSNAQEFGTHWISHPLPNDSAEVLFRRSYNFKDYPIQAFIDITSTGDYKLYINERNVTASLKFDGVKDGTLLCRTIDITRYIQKGNNIFAIWYAPEGKSTQGRQLSLDFRGWNQDSTAFYYQADGSWLCQQIRSCSIGKSERFDARVNIKDWKTEEYQIHSGWLHPTGSYATLPLPIKEYRVFQAENKLARILHPVATYSDSLGYHIGFGRPFRGTIRLTLRNAKKGDQLYFNGYQYTCNGKLDEQALFRFKFQRQRFYTLTWNGRFRKSDIVNIEGLEISE